MGFFRGGDGGLKEYILSVSKLKPFKLRSTVYEIKKQLFSLNVSYFFYPKAMHIKKISFFMHAKQ